MRKLLVMLLSLSILMFTPVLAMADEIETLSFSDVEQGMWYSEAVDYMTEHGLINGYKDTNLFGTNDPMTRAQFAAVLWRYYDPYGAASFDQANAVNTTGLPDVEDHQWYTGAANWAVENGIISGTDIGSQKYFEPNANMTFEQEIVILARSTEQQPSNVDESVLNQFLDRSRVSPWAMQSMAWFVERGLVGGSNGFLNPLEQVNRARASTILYRFITNTTVTPSQPQLSYGPGYVILPGTIIREERTTDMTGMGFSAVVYYLVFDRPLTLTYDSGLGSLQTATTSRVQVASIEQYLDNANKNMGSIIDPYWQQFVGTYVSVGGDLWDTGTAHTQGACMLENAKVVS